MALNLVIETRLMDLRLLGFRKQRTCPKCKQSHHPERSRRTDPKSQHNTAVHLTTKREPSIKNQEPRRINLYLPHPKSFSLKRRTLNTGSSLLPSLSGEGPGVRSFLKEPSIKNQVSRKMHGLLAALLFTFYFLLSTIFKRLTTKREPSIKNQEPRRINLHLPHPKSFSLKRRTLNTGSSLLPSLSGEGPGVRSFLKEPSIKNQVSRKMHGLLAALLFTLYFLLFTELTPLHAQLLTPLSHEMNRRVEWEMARTNTPFFTVLKPYVDTQLRGNARQDSLDIIEPRTKNQESRQRQSSDVILSAVEGYDLRLTTYDSVSEPRAKNQEPRQNHSDVILSGVEGSSEEPGARSLEPRPNTWLHRKLFHESFIQVDSGDFYLFADPVFEFGVGKEIDGNNTYINTRGFRIGGRLGNHIAFGADFYENLGKFNTVVSSRFYKTRIAPGEGWARKTDTTTYDFAHSSGYLTVSLFKNLNFTLAQGRQFIGDGYRSLLLSDASYTYPYLNFTWVNKHFMYSWSNMLFQDIDVPYPDNKPPLRRKSATMHLAGINFNKFQISLIKLDLYKNPDSLGHYKMDWNQMNPMLIPVKRDNKNTILGTNFKFTPFKFFTIYNQLALINPYNDSSRKVCLQVGGKFHFSLNNHQFYIQAEYNQIPSFAYTSGDKIYNWEHLREPLMHPYGTNLKEMVITGIWNYKRWQLLGQLNNAGQLENITSLTPYTLTRFPYFVNERKLSIFKGEITYYFNGKTLMNASLGLIYRKETIAAGNSNMKYIYFSLGTRLFNRYYDF